MDVRVIAILLCCLLSISNSNRTFVEYAADKTTDSEEFAGGDSEVINLLNFIAEKYLKKCVNVILYDEEYGKSAENLNFNVEFFLKKFPANFINGEILEKKRINERMLQPIENECRNFVLLVKDVSWTTSLLGPLRISKVVVVTVSSRWKIEEYLENREARAIVNLLIVSYNWKKRILFKMEDPDNKIKDINLYTHNLYTDGLGSSSFRLLTSWRNGSLVRDMDLFPKKMSRGFNGRQFTVAASEQPPFTFKKRISVVDDANESHLWDGVEIRLLRLLSGFMNYTVEIVEPKMHKSAANGPSERVIDEVAFGGAEIGSAGVYVTNDRIQQIMPSVPHTTDCAAFITKASTAIPGQRAILGPFQWTVWLALTITYMSAVIPITFADSHSLKPLLKNPWQLENMFWHVFGTFTNCFTFTEANSWSKTKKTASRLFIGMYWAFTIIVTACYTGSIVSFITLFVFPDVVDNIDQLLKKNFRVGTLSTGGWSHWFNDSDHEKTRKLLRDVELVPNTTQGLKNVSESFYLPMFRPYAFLAGRAQMEYIVQANYTHTTKKKEMLHISKECFVPFSVSYVFPVTAAYSDVFNEYILRVQQSGLMGKLLNEFKWEIERSASGKLLQAGSGIPLREIVPLQRKLTLDDTQGMYILMGAGYLLGLIALISEMIHYSKKQRKNRSAQDRLRFIKFWKWRCFTFITIRIPAQLWPIKGRISPEDKPNGMAHNYQSYKTYDSRILGLRSYNDAKIYFSELQLNHKHNLQFSCGSRSLPNIAKQLFDQDHQMRILEWDLNDANPQRRRDLDMVFGSINSLPWELNKFVHRSGWGRERAQSC